MTPITIPDRLADLLEELHDWFEDRADAEIPEPGASMQANDEMKFADRLKEFLK